MVLLNEVISTKIMIELVIFEILFFVERTKNTAGYRTTLPYLPCATKGNFSNFYQAARIISFCA